MTARQQFHFLSGLPRSGSTLLSAIRQVQRRGLFAQYQDMRFWHDVANSRASVITAKKSPSPLQESL
jgi:hypothetical protein